MQHGMFLTNLCAITKVVREYAGQYVLLLTAPELKARVHLKKTSKQFQTHAIPTIRKLPP